MKPRDLQALNARLDILAIALVELARSTPSNEARRVAEGIQMGLNGRMQRAPLRGDADAAAAADLAPILAALARH